MFLRIPLWLSSTLIQSSLDAIRLNQQHVATLTESLREVAVASSVQVKYDSFKAAKLVQSIHFKVHGQMERRVQGDASGLIHAGDTLHFSSFTRP